MPLAQQKRMVGWVRRIGRHPRWRAVTQPCRFTGEVLTVMAKLDYWDAEDECSVPGWTTVILPEGEVPWRP